MVCRITANVELLISGMKQSLCFIAKDVETGAVSMYVVIRIQSLRLECVQTSLYYTFQPKLNVINHSNCYGRDYCSEGAEQSCKKFLDQENMANEMFPAHLGKLRIKKCGSNAGCAGNGCFYCSDGCAFSSISVENPNQESYQVMSCSSWRYKVIADINLKRSGLSFIHTLSLEDATSKEVDDLTFTLKSATTSPSGIISKCFMRKAGLIAMVDCQGTSEMNSGKVGEVRCQTVNDALYPGPNCKIASSSVITERAGWSWLAKLNSVNISKQFMNGLLPQAYGGYLVQSDSDQIFMLAPPNSILSINLQMKNYQLELVKTKDSCYSTNVNVKGCHSCSEGANLTITISNDHKLSPDSTLMSHFFCSSSGINALIPISSKGETFSTMIYTNSDTINEYCNFTCGTQSQKMLLISKLETKMEIDPLSNSKFDEGAVDEGRVLTHWDLLKDLWGDFNFRLKLGMSFLTMILVLIIVCVIVKTFRGRSQYLSIKQP